jgi:hypothetical protein
MADACTLSWQQHRPVPIDEVRPVSEREGSQRERGATTAVRSEGRGPDRQEERA